MAKHCTSVCYSMHCICQLLVQNFKSATPFFYTAMRKFYQYFSHEEIIRLLCKYRLKYAKQRHKVHLLRDISLHPKTLEAFQTKGICPSELSSILPPRRSWLRLNEKQRKFYKSSKDVAFESLRRTVLTTHIKVTQGAIKAPAWYEKLIAFIEEIQNRINGKIVDKIKTPKIIAIQKDHTNKYKYRPISQYRLSDRIVIGQTARYLTELFDDQLSDSAYAFRAKVQKKKARTHHDCVDKILEFKFKSGSNSIWIAECDISKFFDCINHKTIESTFNDFVQNANENCDSKAVNIFNEYLNSYAFNIDVNPLNSSDFFKEKKLNDAYFEWVEEDLKNYFYGETLNNERIGVPQGGALSCLIANLIMHSVDDFVLTGNYKNDICYLRFCDDMIILTNSQEDCNQALNNYMEELNRLLLLAHKPTEIFYYNKSFFNQTKSKSPYKWGFKKDEKEIPWISFVGYQIRWDGCIRARKKSIIKEIEKQKKEAEEVLKAIHSHDKENLNNHSRKSLKQQVYALENRLISMSAGRVKMYNYKTVSNSLCWTNGFKKVSNHFTSKTQLRLLDKNRNKQLYRVKKELQELVKMSENPDLLIPPNKFFGAPFSYYSLLHVKIKSTNDTSIHSVPLEG
jgi:hypothetical protein